PGNERHGLVIPILSVPSSSGKGLQRGIQGEAWASSAAFQSPLHRGRVFNSMSNSFITSSFIILSVPSSSGKGLQPAHDSVSSANVHAFSPLFIGEGSSTTGCHCRENVISTSFQSPLHRGRVFNCACGVRMWRAHAFSPLFIGEGSSTPFEPWRERRERQPFQSPLHRGRVFNCSSV